MKYLLDTCVISDFIKGEPNTSTRLKNISPTEITVSSITVMEIFYGIALNPKYAKTIKPIISDFLDAVTIVNFDKKDAAQVATTRAILKQQERPIGSYDILLAGIALNRELILVSANSSEFERIKGLTIENWRTVNK